MAIQIEQQQKSVSWVKIASAVIIVAVLFAGAYFLFFKKPELIEVVVPGQFEDLTQLSEIELNANELLESPQFQMLRQYSLDSSPPSPGKSNPFQP